MMLMIVELIKWWYSKLIDKTKLLRYHNSWIRFKPVFGNWKIGWYIFYFWKNIPILFWGWKEIYPEYFFQATTNIINLRKLTYISNSLPQNKITWSDTILWIWGSFCVTLGFETMFQKKALFCKHLLFEFALLGLRSLRKVWSCWTGKLVSFKTYITVV